MKGKIKEEDPELKRKFLLVFLLFFPTLIIAVVPDWGIIGLSVKVLLAFYQFIVIKNFVDSFYGE